MISMLAAILVGCAPQPASIKFDGEPVVTVHTTDAVPAAKATVLDKNGKAIDPQPTLTWTVGPETVAKLDAARIAPVGNGEAVVGASVGEVKAEYKLVVALPDKVELSGYTPGTAWPAGQSAQLTAAVKAGDTVVEGQQVAWATSNEQVATVDAGGNVTGVADGTATITATSGALTASVDVTIGAAVAATDAPAQ